MLLGTHNKGRTVWHCAAIEGHVERLNKLWKWVKENLTIEEINNKLLLGTDNEGMTVWHWAAMRGHLKTLKNFGSWLKRI